MINETLEFVAQSALEVMMAENISEVDVALTPNTVIGSIDLKIRNTPFSMKSKHIGNTLEKQNLDFLMDEQILLKVSTAVIPVGEAFEVLKKDNKPIKIEIFPVTSFAKKFLEAYSREEPTVKIPVINLPKFDNPQL